MQSNGRRWIDVREYREFRGGYIDGSELVPLGELERACESWDRKQPLTVVCRSGARAGRACAQLKARGFKDVLVLPGGILQWRTSGRPVKVVERKPWAMERQVRAGAGSLVLISLALARWVSPDFLLMTGFVGAGLVFAGVTDICLMARVLSKLPWNRDATSPVC